MTNYYKRDSNQSVLTDSSISSIRLLGMRGYSHTKLADLYGVSRKTIYDIMNNNTWNHVPSPVRAYGFPDYLVLPDGRVYSNTSEQFITPQIRKSDNAPVVRIKASSGKRVTVPVANLVARGYLGVRAKSPQIQYLDGNPRNTHFTNVVA